MKTFYLRTDKFWNFSRILFTLLFISAVVIVLFNSDLEPRNLIGYFLLGIYISLMGLILFRRAYKKFIPSAVKVITGVMSILLGFLMSYTILTNPNIGELLKIGFHFIPVWLVFLGLRDIILRQNNYSIEKQTIDGF